MNLQLVEKLKSLIASSSILSQSEKQEWEALLELMNDKQMFELQKILDSNQLQAAGLGTSALKTSAVATVVSRPSVIPKTAAPIKLSLPEAILKPQKQEPVQKPAVVAKSPHLGHIVNLPQFRVLDNRKTAKVEAGEGQAKAKSLSFMQKLKAMIREPELPPGRPENLLPAHTDLLKSGGSFEPKLVLKTAKPQEKPLPPKVPLAPVKNAANQKTKLSGLVGQAPLAVPRKVQEEPKPALQTVAEVLEQKAKKDAQVKGGLQNWPDSYNVKQKKNVVLASDLPKAVFKKAQTPEEALERDAFLPKYDTSKITKPEELENFQSNWLGDQATKKLKELTKRFGYHNVIFHLEKSPLYQSYLATGSEILEKDSNFETLAKTEENVLSQKSFEKVADLLRAIQSE